jgi:hypothetical protein
MMALVGQGPSQLPQLGRRGAGWTILQGLLIAAVLLSALLGLGWPDGLELAASIVGGLLGALGVLLLVGGALQLGSSLTPLPAPRAGGELTTTGALRPRQTPDVRRRHPLRARLVDDLRQPARARIDGPARAVPRAEGSPRRALAARSVPAYAEYRRRPRKFLPFLY